MLFSLASIGLASVAQGLIQYRENGLDYGKCNRKANCDKPRALTKAENKVWTDLYNDQRGENERWCYCDKDAPIRGDFCADYEKTCDKSFTFNECKAKYCVDGNGDLFLGQEMKACQTTYCKSIFDLQRDNRRINANIEGADGEFWDAADKDREVCEILYCSGLQANEFTQCQNSFCNFSYNPTFPGTTETTIMNNRIKCMFANYKTARMYCNDVDAEGNPQTGDDLQKSRGVNKYWRKWSTTKLGREVRLECVATALSGNDLNVSKCMSLANIKNSDDDKRKFSRLKRIALLDARTMKNKARGHCKQVLYDFFHSCINNNFNTKQCVRYRKAEPRPDDPDFIMPEPEVYSSCAPARQNTCAEPNLVSDAAWDLALTCTEDPSLNDESNDACMCPKGYYRQNHHQDGKCVLQDDCRVLDGYTPP